VLERLAGAGAFANEDPLLTAGFVYGMVIQHEHQHDETLLATLQLMPAPGYRPPSWPAALPSRAPTGASGRPGSTESPASAEVLIPGGPFTMGTDTDPWALDNERPAHVLDVDPFFIDRYPVTNRDYGAFVGDGGYAEPRWWTPTGWDWRCSAGLARPQFWDDDGGLDRFGRLVDVNAGAGAGAEPVQHVCWYEADAYARWAGKRLPTEAEWEKAASWGPDGVKRRWPWGDNAPTPVHANLGQRHFGPVPVGSYPAGASAWGVEQMIGDVWEWTSSDFAAHPGFAAVPYREYSEVFFGPAYKVLRGGSWATDPVAMRSTFRNWDYPIRRQIFAGFRCARSSEQS
jgi:gamma-glutamyl hercynylcysteine S-oxide synthase